MTDKVQKIKEWISKEQDGLMDAQGNFEYPEHEGAYHILCNLDTYIDSLQEEPISEELEEAAKNHAVERYRATRDMVLAEKCKWSFKEGAEWQKKQDQSTIELAEDHAMLAGMEKMKEEMMEKAVEGGCFSYKNGFVHISCDVDEHLTDVKFGDKVKVIVIKED